MPRETRIYEGRWGIKTVQKDNPMVFCGGSQQKKKEEGDT